ncbi:KAP-like [Commensalibacter communis]|uniref:KAP-like n=1 Tax=Commensalibacter communis TaxID=2972786 RepID=A0A9W4X7G6_9PROT|nr:P-loop NTPase fold protein [Commensalibacter communis]CAI3955880.1 KAP-like [Commensalibacter communis]CAI3958831.1 KAP-like [Commensalibacter communis]CAI3958989.1 KAP-like [Commensalibacter communis]CAI3960357.1 KAP-like [Commensalibacter communis]
MNDISANSLSADSPITDLAADCLGYSPFAKNIATILDNATTRGDCLVLGIHGEWGSGKTSAINLVIEHLKWMQRYRPKYAKFKILNDLFLYKTFEPDRPLQIKETKPRTTIIHFSPWLFSNQENLTTAFFHELEKQLDNSWDNIKAFLKTIAALTLPSLEALSYLNPATSKMVGNTTQLLIKNLQKRPSLEQTKRALNKALKAQKRPLLIIIDDIDRLPADEMRQIFRLVKSIADLPYVTYLLGFDRKIVERALEKDTDPEGPQWIEKIVQGSFDLPLILQPRLELYFIEKLNKQLNDLYKLLFDNIELSFYLYPFFNILIYKQLKTPRQVNRLINSLTLQWMATKKFINPFDLIFIESCRLFRPKLYSLIKNNKQDFCGQNRTFLDLVSKLIFQEDSKQDIESFKICFLNESPYPLMKSKRISSEKYFENYFLYDQNPAFLPVEETEIIDDLLSQNNTEEIIKIIIQNINEKLEGGYPKNLALLDEWQENIRQFENNELKNVLTIITATHNQICVKNRLAATKSNALFLDICKIFSYEKEFDTFIPKLYKQYPLSNLLIHYIQNCKYVRLNGYIEDNIISNFLDENITILQSIKEIYKEKITELENNKGLKAISHNLIFLITAATETEASGKYRGVWIQEKIKDNEENALCIIKSITLDPVSGISLHENFQSKRYYGPSSLIHNNVNLHPLFNAAISIHKNSNNEESKQIVHAFLVAYQYPVDNLITHN